MFKIINRQPNVLAMLICLTSLFIAAQIIFFLIHYQVSNLIDSLVNTSILLQLMHPVVLLPIAFFILMQCFAYALFVMWIWFISISTGKLFKLSSSKTYGLSILVWCMACLTMLLLNQFFFPASFFAKGLPQASPVNEVILVFCSLTFVLMTLVSYMHFFWHRQYMLTGSILLCVIISFILVSFYEKKLLTSVKTIDNYSQPNVILIGLDSLRPDFIDDSRTPHIAAFLKNSLQFTQAYTPLARTFPAWISILTAKYPKHNAARNNLVEPQSVVSSDTLAKQMRANGYETMYASDDKRFSNITKEYGFNKILGPRMGVNDFLLGGLSDFPLTNLLLKLPGAKWLFPFNYGNRAAAITYEPRTFLQLVKAGLVNRSPQPLFLAVHLCLAHWPFTWANDGQKPGLRLPQQYTNSVQALDKQFSALLTLLEESGLLKNTMVVLLSDHGTALGQLGDRLLNEKNFQGNKKYLEWIPKLKLSSAPEFTNNKNDFSINTSYGQGNNVLSAAQYHVLLAFKQYGQQDLPKEKIANPVLLMDIAPTVLDFLHLAPLLHADGISLREMIFNKKKYSGRFFYLETGDSISQIETDYIYVEKVIRHEIGIYNIDIKNGLLMMSAKAEQGLIKNKQLAVMQGPWLLAYYPAQLEKKWVHSGKQFIRKTSVIPAYFVLANLQTKEWTIGLHSTLASKAPVRNLLDKLKKFYGDELPGEKHFS